MKRIRLLLIALAVMVGMAANATDWTGSAVGEGTYYLYNVGADKFLNIGNKSDDSWGANANLTTNSNFDFDLASVSDGVYTIDSKVSNGGDNHYLNSSTWCDGGATHWTFRAVDGETNVYQIIFDGQYLMATEGLDDVEMLGDPGSRTTSTYWKLVTLSDRKAALTGATEAAPKDATFLITAPNFGRNDTRNNTWQGSPAIGGEANKASCNFNAEKYNTTFDVYQTISEVPNGWYKLYVQGYYRDGDIATAASAYNGNTENLYAKYYINNANAPLMSIFDDSGKSGNNGSTTEGITGKFPNDRENQMDAFNAGLYENIPLIVNVTDGNIRVGVKAETLTTNAWTGFDNFRLEYLGTTEPSVVKYEKIKNPKPFVHGTGWTISATPTNYDASNSCAEFWKMNNATMKQTLTSLPAGYYTLTAVALTRTGYTTELSANDNKMNIVTVGNTTVNDKAQANSWFNDGNGVNNLTFRLTEAGNVEIGLKVASQGDGWTVWRSFELKYHGEYPISITAPLLDAAVTEAESLYASLPTDAKNTLKAVVDANNTSYSSGKGYSDAADAVNAAIVTARPLIEPYARYQSIRTAALAISAGVNTSTTDSEVATATTAEAIEAAIATLRAAFLAELPNVTIPNDPGYIDVTSVMVDNASVSANVDYWTYNKTSGNGPTTNYGETEFYNANFKFYQTLSLTPGTWEFGVTGFHRAGNHNTNFYAGVDKILIPGVASDVVNTMAQAKTYFDGGNGKVALKFLIESAQDVEIGINNQDTETDKWTIFRDFTLKYYGAPDYTVYEDQWDALVSDAATAKTTYANSIGTELTALNAAIADSPEGSNLKATYLAKIEALQTALNTFNAAGPNYDALVREIAKAKALGIASATADGYAATSSSTAATVLASTQALMVDEYNYVTTNYSYAVSLGTWNASDNAGTMTSQHWDGTTTSSYLEQGAGDLAYSLSSWTVTYNQNLTLPAGNYVFKVAGRTALDHVTLTLNVTNVATSAVLGTVNDFPKGDTGLGINKDGATSFDAEDAAGFANNGNGRGWQWRYLKFTLAEPATVNVGVVAEADAQNRWMGFCNATVQTDDDDNVALMTALVALNDAKTAATLTERANKGTGVFQYNEATDDALWTAYSTAKSNADAFTLAADTEVGDVTALTTALNDAKDAYNANDVLNAPDASKRYKLTLANKGALTFFKNPDAQSGYGMPFQAAGDYKAQTFQFEAVSGKTNTYLIYFTDNEGQKRYICNGIPWGAGTGASGIRTLLASDVDPDNNKTALEIQIQPAATDGVFYMLNTTVDNAKLGAQNNGDLYTVADNSDWSIAEASQAEFTVSCKAGKYGTVIFPFTPDVSSGFDGITFYRCRSVNNTTNKVQIEVVAEPQANTPYLIYNAGEDNFSKVVTGWGTATADSYTDEEGLLTGVYTNANINGVNRYVLQTQDDVQAFYKVNSDFTATPYKCYLTYSSGSGSTAHMLKLFFDEDETTGINGLTPNPSPESEGSKIIYDLQGRKVQNPKHGMYIINGKKVVVK